MTRDETPDYSASGDQPWTFRWERPVHDAFPALHMAQSAWLAEIDELPSPDRKTRELIRLVCNVSLRSAPAVERHAGLAREYGATWDEVLGALMLVVPSFGLLPTVEMIEPARRGFDTAEAIEGDDDDNSDDAD